MCDKRQMTQTLGYRKQFSSLSSLKFHRMQLQARHVLFDFHFSVSERRTATENNDAQAGAEAASGGEENDKQIKDTNEA